MKRYGTDTLVTVDEVEDEDVTPAKSPALRNEELDRVESEMGEIQLKYEELEQRRVQLTETSRNSESNGPERTYSGLTTSLLQGLGAGMPRQYPSRRSPFVQNQISKGKARRVTLTSRGGFTPQGDQQAFAFKPDRGLERAGTIV